MDSGPAQVAMKSTLFKMSTMLGCQAVSSKNESGCRNSASKPRDGYGHAAEKWPSPVERIRLMQMNSDGGG